IAPHPHNVIFLTCDAFGVLPLVSKLNVNQAMYYFMSGYTAKIPGTEMGIKEPTATFSACFGDAFIVCHPSKYAYMFKNKIEKHGVNVWLVNTGWIGSVERCPLKYTRRIIDAIHNNELLGACTKILPIFNLEYITEVCSVPSNILDYCDQDKLRHLAISFIENFKKYQAPEIEKHGPQI
ncbi:hypothetical protein LCGC14_2165770, partial [marine sediment metagenome]